MKPTTAVAVSGGVDSLMAAYLLKERGHPVVGFHFLTGYESNQQNITAIADQLDIPVHIVDLADEFDDTVVRYFLKTYMAGKTPNPCLICNPTIKFGLLLDQASQKGIDRLATGHYARIVKSDQHPNRIRLLKGIDKRKDQSYFLAFLTQQQLSRALFPLGDLEKETVKKLAIENGMMPVTRKESQDVCFINEHTYAQFLAQHLGAKPNPGDIVDQNGRVLGRHEGLHLFTVGQRRGIDCPASEPYYVLRLDTEHNRLVVGQKQDTLSEGCRVERVNWIIQPLPSEPIRVRTRVRYRHKEADATLIARQHNQAEVRFDTPQSSIAPGQGAVFYIDEEVIGAGLIV
jgi:tRNA-specific 2-thiouridylase